MPKCWHEFVVFLSRHGRFRIGADRVVPCYKVSSQSSTRVPNSFHPPLSGMSNNQAPYVLPGEPLHEFLRSFWQRQIDAAEQETIDYRHPPLPLARIKKVMKSDPDVKVSAEPLAEASNG